MATTNDAEQILAIYSPFCLEHSPVSFEFTPPLLSEMNQRIENTLASLPWLVWAEGDTVLGYAYASAHRSRAAYQWSVDVSAYIDATRRNSGVASRLYAALFDLLRLRATIAIIKRLIHSADYFVSADNINTPPQTVQGGIMTNKNDRLS